MILRAMIPMAGLEPEIAPREFEGRQEKNAPKPSGRTER